PHERKNRRKRLADTRELCAVTRHLALDRRGRRMRADEPRVAHARGALDRAVVVGRDPDRGMRLLHRPAGPRDLVETTHVGLDADLLLGEQAPDDLQALLEPAHALALRHLERVELDVTIAEPDAEDEVAPPDHVERRDTLRDLHGIVEAGEDD